MDESAPSRRHAAISVPHGLGGLCLAGSAGAQNLLDTPLPRWAVDTAAQMCTALRDPETAQLQQLSSLIDWRVWPTRPSS